MRNTIIVIFILIIGAVGVYFLISHLPKSTPSDQMMATTTPDTSMATTTKSNATVIGKSVEGRDITAYTYGTGTTSILFVGGLHGGYEWNTSVVAYDLMDYLTQHPDAVAANETVTVIPVVNPDGLNKIVGTTTAGFSTANLPALADTVVGRFNANTVDLNRNFDCDWQAKGVWQTKSVSGGTAAFSEPESKAIEDYIAANKPAAVVVYYSSAGGVYSSSCHNGVSSETAAITKAYASASGYPAHESFDFYATTGDMVNWLAKLNIPAISVLLTNHTDPEWSKNQAGVDAILKHYAQ
jgi:hypothetical protein